MLLTDGCRRERKGGMVRDIGDPLYESRDEQIDG
jgi:hypothetical protein